MSTDPKLCLIVAKSRNGVIGKDGSLPWHLSSDLQFFKKTTMNKPILMGRVTYEDIGRPLPGRPNLVLTRDKNFRAAGVEVFNEAFDMIGRGFEIAGLRGENEVMLIGGAQLYASCIKFVDKMYVTEVDAIVDGDAHFPAILAPDWKTVSEKTYPKGRKDDYPFQVKIYERR